LPAKRRGDPRVVAWLEQEKEQCYTSAVVIAQLAYWVRTKEGRQRQEGYALADPETAGVELG
jgi:predicted nucleic acid-binding protein